MQDQDPHTTFSDLDDEYGNLIEEEVDNDIRDFIWFQHLDGFREIPTATGEVE